MVTRKRLIIVIAAALVGLGSVVAQSQLQERQSPASREHHAPPVVGANPGPNFGDPLPGLTSAQLEDFAEDLDEFQGEDSAESGLGPGFNNVSCVACHSTPAPGGGSAILETRFGRLVNGVFDPLTGSGGSLLQEFAIESTAQEFIPAEANVVAKRITTPLLGAGLIEAIPDGEILINSLLRKPDGVSGRPSIVLDVATATPASAASAGRLSRPACFRSPATLT